MYLTSDAVISATHDTMEDTIQYLNDKYGNVTQYLHEVKTFLLPMSTFGIRLESPWYHYPDLAFLASPRGSSIEE